MGSATLAPASAKHSWTVIGAAAVKRVDIGGEVPVVELENKMARQPDAEHRHMQAPCDFHVHHSQRDGDAGPALQHLIQTTVQGIEKIGLVPVETQLAEQVTAGFFDEIASVVEIAEAITQGRSKFVQLVQERLRLEIREVDTGQIQCRAVHADLGAFLRQNLLQIVQMLHLPLLYPARRISQLSYQPAVVSAS